MNRFVVDNVEYMIVRNPYTNGPMIARVDGLPIENRKEICRRFLRQHGWTDEMFKNKITNALESEINNIVNGKGNIPGERVANPLSKSGSTKEKKPRVPRKPKEQVDSVIIVRMYAGGYLDENIGHEIINTFKTDNGRHFIYVSPWGTINKDFAESKNVLLVRGISAEVWEVIGYATKLELLLSEEAIRNGKHKEIDLLDSKVQLNHINNRGITYGDVAINDILSEQKNTVFATFETKEYHAAKKENQLYLVSNKKLIKGDNYIYIPTPKEKFGKQSLHMYMDEKKHKEAYDILLGLFNDSKWWENDTCHKIENLDEFNDSFNVLDVIRRDEDELTFSNWLAFYLANDEKFLLDFSKNILGIDIDTGNCQVKREYKNIDIWLEDENNVVVIENKIKSGINGIVEERHDFSKDKIKSQLSKYVKIAQGEAKGRATMFKLLIPDYGVSDEELSVYQEYDKYLPVLRYSALLKFLESHSTNLPYYEDYKKAVMKHASPYKKNLYQIMEERLIAKIKSKK